ncbi:MAG: ImmA/IrrE family metallo-endopeptidase [Dehalococcoidia bacterium]|jgi:Zn-dependent peptidase ImmA (M78 family)
MRAKREIEKARALWTGLGLEAPVDLHLICDQLGVSILRRDIPELTQDISAAYIKNGHRAIILVNVVDSLWKQRFSMAHEIYHHILLNNLPVHGRICILRSGLGMVDDEEVEHKCDRFAEELLMPQSLVIKWHDELQYNHEFRLQILAERFNIGEEIMHKRIVELRLTD